MKIIFQRKCSPGTGLQPLKKLQGGHHSLPDSKIHDLKTNVFFRKPAIPNGPLCQTLSKNIPKNQISGYKMKNVTGSQTSDSILKIVSGVKIEVKNFGPLWGPTGKNRSEADGRLGLILP
jgi:hypothetical protein